jgi:protein required for attachment to host cells
MKPLRTEFIIADGARARWVKRAENADDFVTIKELKAGRRPQGKTKGVVFDSTTHRGYGMEARADAVLEHSAMFAKQVAEAINVDADRQDLERLVIAAPARTLAAISDHLSAAAKAKLAKTLAKDLTKTPDHELKDWLHPLELG